jgi:hypothetical protein
MQRDENQPEPRHLALVALAALATYKKAGLPGKGDHMHELLAVRLSRVAKTGSWDL